MFIMQVLASQLHFLANKNAELAIPPLFWPVNCIKIEGHVALLSDPIVYSLYCVFASFIQTLLLYKTTRHSCSTFLFFTCHDVICDLLQCTDARKNEIDLLIANIPEKVCNQKFGMLKRPVVPPPRIYREKIRYLIFKIPMYV